jgi:exodeoxyribonuclease VII small subunit
MAKQKINFQKAIEELESITEWFEKGEVDLEEGLKKFERALELASACKEKMDEFENKVKEIKAKFSDV